MFKKLKAVFSNTEVIGLDIGSHSIKVVEIDHRKDRRVLTTYAIAKHSVNIEGYWDSKTLRQLSTQIGEVLDKSHFVGVKTVMSVRSKDVYVTSMDFEPSLHPRQIEHEINAQAPFFLPHPPEQTRLSWTLLPNVTSTGKRRAVINAIPDFVVENSRNLLEHLNLDGEALENQTLAHIRSNLEGSDKNCILGDIGNNYTVLSMVVRGGLRSSTFLHEGTHNVLKAVSDKIGVERNISENFMKDLNMVDLKHLPKQLLDFYEILRSEISTFASLNSQIGQAVDEIVFTGGGSQMPGVIEFFNNFDLPTRIAYPLNNLEVEEGLLPYVSPLANQLSTAIGLAKRKV